VRDKSAAIAPLACVRNARRAKSHIINVKTEFLDGNCAVLDVGEVVPRVSPVTLSSPIGSPNIGVRAAVGWLEQRKLHPPTQKRWHVEVSLSTDDGPASVMYDERVDSRFHIDIYSEEWGVFFCHGGRASWIRVTDIAFVHGRDEFELLPRVPELHALGPFLRDLERRHGLAFRRQHALVRTNLPTAEPTIRRWIESI
jgi:hypothetical protein